MDALTIGATVGIIMALTKIIEKLVDKFTPAKEDQTNDKMALALNALAQSQERICETLDRVESRLEKTADAVQETRFKIFNGHQ